MIFDGCRPNGCTEVTLSQIVYDLLGSRATRMTVMAAPAATSRVELAYATIRERIIAGTYGPGYRLVLDELAREIGSSPVPVREAIRRLEAEGWVEYQRHVGARVASFDE